MTDTLSSSNCTDLDDTGCSMLSKDSSSYGTSFNAANGGVYAAEWNQVTGIKVWFFPRGDIPADVSSDSPDPQTWGTPAASIPAENCDMSTHFYDMQLVLNTNFCGSWANRTWTTSGCAKKASTCEEFVRKNPEAFTEAYWEGMLVLRLSGSEPEMGLMLICLQSITSRVSWDRTSQVWLRIPLLQQPAVLSDHLCCYSGLERWQGGRKSSSYFKH